jgi:benzoylsuccinyl-CoA thiolase BbsA subunit
MAETKPRRTEYVPPQLTAFPIVAVDPADRREKLSASRCVDCKSLTFPPAPLCSKCGGQKVAPAPLSEHGTLYSYSVLHVGARGWLAPYVLGYVDLPEGVRVFSHIDGAPEALRIDMPVSLEIREPIKNAEDQDVLAFAFRPSN